MRVSNVSSAFRATPALRAVAMVLAAVVLSACNWDGNTSRPEVPTEETPRPPEPRLLKISGDGQTVLQHSRMEDSIAVHVTDASGAGVQGVEVRFTAAPGSGNFSVRNSVSDVYGNAYFNTWFHTAGIQQINAEANGYGKVTFTLNVEPTGMPYDGLYQLSFSGVERDLSRDPPPTHIIDSASVLIAIIDGQLVDPNVPRTTTWIVAGSFSSTDGTLAVSFRLSPDRGAAFTGQLSLDGNAPGGAGTWQQLWRGQPVPDNGGTWTASRF